MSIRVCDSLLGATKYRALASKLHILRLVSKRRSNVKDNAQTSVVLPLFGNEQDALTDLSD